MRAASITGTATAANTFWLSITRNANGVLLPAFSRIGL